jgi:hypothetical protein
MTAQAGAGDLDAAIIMLPLGTPPPAPLLGRIIATVHVAIVQSRRRPLCVGRFDWLAWSNRPGS